MISRRSIFALPLAVFAPKDEWVRRPGYTIVERSVDPAILVAWPYDGKTRKALALLDHYR